jgi:CubicO group peptidase (beta-lactamase class C family)
MKRLLLTFVTLFCYLSITSQTGIAVPEMSHCDTQALNFMSTYNIPSMTFAMSKDGKLVYSRAFGNANISGTEATQPYHMFRIASVSKPITSVGIMKMVENGDINLSDKVFGTGGLLENHWYFSTTNITDSRIYDITVQMLLEHNAGWDRSVNCFPNPTTPYPWFFGGCDPIIAPMHITEALGESNPVKEEHLIAFLLEKGLNNNPGTVYAYSNMGYLVLSEIIEEVSGMSYEAWMQQNIFNPIGIYDMYIGKNLLAEKREREGEYVGNGYTTLDLYGSGNSVPWEYGGFSIEAMDGHGGWIATAKDLARLLVAVDGFSTSPDILNSASITTMTTPSVPASFYAKGWSVNAANNWWHTGAVDGTASIFVRTSGGYTWAIILNKRVVGANANNFWNALDGLGWNCLSGTTTFPTHDLFDSPTLNASGLNEMNVTDNSMDLNWLTGNGSNRIVVMKQIPQGATESNFEAYPLDGLDYTANTVFGLGDDLGDGSFVVYNGTGNSTSIQGLSSGANYAIRIYEYRKNTNNGNNALYLLGNAPEILVSTSSLSVSTNELDANIVIFPNPTNSKITLQNNGNISLKNAVILDVNGRILQTINLVNMSNQKEVSLLNYANGVYFIKINSNNGSVVKRLIKQ